MAKSDKGPLKGIATFTGHVAGAVQGGISGIVHAGHGGEEPRHMDVSFEASDLHARGTFLTGAGLAVGLVAVLGVAFLYFVFLAHRRAVESPAALPISAHGNPMPPEPRIQAAPRQDLKAFQAREDWMLHHYYWIDQRKGTVAIPIERAMRMVAERGIPPQNTPPNPTLTPPEAGTRNTGFEGKVEPEAR